jgi:hypothetical protein
MYLLCLTTGEETNTIVEKGDEGADPKQFVS